jgi:hypothetical protein
MAEEQTIRQLSKELYIAKIAGTTEIVDDIQAQIDSLVAQSVPTERPNPVAANAILNDDDASPIAVFEFLNQSLGKEWPTWEFETIEKMLWVDYSFAFEEENRDKVQALKVIAQSDAPFDEWYAFNQVATSLTGHTADFFVLKHPSPGMCLVALTTMKHIRPEEEVGFDVGKFICVVLNDAGIYTPPPSHFETLRDDMERMVTKEIRDSWPEVMQIYADYLSDKISEFPETIAGIQAMRLMNTESAHEEFLR